MHALFFRASAGLILPALLTAPLTAADWPGFRGPNGSGVAATSVLPVKFSPTENVVWKTPLPAGKSSPVLTDQHIFLTAGQENDLLTIAMDRKTGQVLWRQAVQRDRSEQLHQLNSPASSTPATDGTNVYVFFGDFGLVSYGPDGNERWLPPGKRAKIDSL
jgi:outer membrane protein assembly factor BamB